MVLGSSRTPAAHRERLRTADVALEVIGDNHVDLASALRHLNEDRGITAVRVDAGPGLNGALLRADLLDEVSVLVAPYLVGDGRGLLDGHADESPRSLELTSAEPQPDGHVRLRYTVRHG